MRENDLVCCSTRRCCPRDQQFVVVSQLPKETGEWDFPWECAVGLALAVAAALVG